MVPLFIAPSHPKTGPGGAISFSAVGGSGTGYTWSVTTANSGSPAIVAGTGVYTAGVLKGYMDVVTVTDSDGNTATRDVQVIDGVSLSTLRQQAKERSDMVNSNFVTTSEWNGMLNTAYQDLYDMLVSKYGENYEIQTPFEFETDGNSDQYPLPPDFYKLLGVDLQLTLLPAGTGGIPHYATIKPFNFAERNRYSINLQLAYGVRANLRYKLMGRYLRIIPRPAGGQTLRVWYVPKTTVLVSDTDVVDGVNGWEEYIVLDAAIKAMVKEESDPTGLMAIKAEIVKRISDIAPNRDAGHPNTVQDTAYQDWWTPPGGIQ